MNADRTVLSDAMWAQVEHMLPGKATDPGGTSADNRLFLEAVLWRFRTGSPWRDLPDRFGNWNSVYIRFRRWTLSGVFERVFNTLSEEFDLECVFVDGTVVQAHQKASGARGGTCRQGIGRSRGGLTSKVVAVVDALGYLVRFVILPGQAHDLTGVTALLDGLPFVTFVGDKAFDADWLLDDLEGRGADAVIPPWRTRTEPREHDRVMYGWRHLVENFFAKIKEFRAIATRYDKTDESFAAGIHLVAGVVAAK